MNTDMLEVKYGYTLKWARLFGFTEELLKTKR